MKTPKRIVLLGATGSIGESTLKVIESHPGELELIGIAARANVDAVAGIARRHRVREIAFYHPDSCRTARQDNRFSKETKFHAGMEGLCHLACLPEADIVLVAVVGVTALEPTLQAIAAGKTIGLASKEILVLAGELVMGEARRHGVQVLPVDSEHNAIFQCLHGHESSDVRRLLLTASGGSFRDLPLEELANVTIDQALQHPNWSMGPKITVDSATMANKGLELIEARWLFATDPERIDVVLHPQSIIHSMVEFVDGSILAQLSPPSMTFAIQHVLFHPRRRPMIQPSLDFSQPFSLEFHPPDVERYPCLRLAKEALRAGGNAPGVFNAANEIAVAAFLAGRIPFLEIHRVIARTMKVASDSRATTLAGLLAVDEEARRIASSFLPSRA